jgi:glycosyltransferase involved in cell wall biosynthesis
MPTPSASKTLVEVRVPTFRRPDLLLRALKSLLRQTWASWRAVVIDDSVGQEGAAVVTQLNDARIIYRPNATNLGRTDNLNFCFRADALLPGSTHACVLEDDNWYDPEWLAANLQSLFSTQAMVLLRNYRLYDVPPDGDILPNSDAVMATLYGDRPRWLTLEDRTRSSFFSYGVGNLAYLWCLNAGLDLSMSQEHFHVHVAETGRCVSFSGPCWFEPAPLASFSRFLDKRQTPSGESTSTTRRRRLAKVSEIAFTLRLRKIWETTLGLPLNPIILDAQDHPEGQTALLKLAESGSLKAFERLKTRSLKLAAFKSWFVFLLYFFRWRQANINSLQPSCLSL